MNHSTRWNVAVSSQADQALRLFLARQGGGKKGDLSRFIEESVLIHILDLTAQQAKDENAHIPEEHLLELIDEAITWARNDS